MTPLEAARPVAEPLDLAAAAALKAVRRKEAVASSTFAGAMSGVLASDGILVLDAGFAEPVP